jgi:hypothetical protein
VFGRLVRAGLLSALSLLVFLCAAGGADAAMALMVHDAMNCGVDDTSGLRYDCRATTPELPSLALPSIGAQSAIRNGYETAIALPRVATTREPPSRHRVPRAPPLA